MLEVKNIYKSYGDKKILNDISFTINEGEIVSLLGSNGCGKTTTFRIMAKLLQPDKGEILLNGRELSLSDIGYLPEERCLYYDCTARQQLKLIASLNNIDEHKIDDILKKLKIEQYGETVVSKLSKGNQQKVAVALCLIKQPEVIIMDEPFTGLDIQNMAIFEDIIRFLKYENKYIIVSSHIYQPVNSIADRYIYVKNGQILFNISRQQLKQDKRRIIHIESEDEYFCEDINIKQLDDNNVIVESDEEGRKLLAQIKKDKSIYGYSYSVLKIEDMVKLYEATS